MANWISIKDPIQLKSAFKNINSNSVFIVEAKPVKPRITKNTTNFQIKLIRRLIYGNKFYIKCENLMFVRLNYAILLRFENCQFQ